MLAGCCLGLTAAALGAPDPSQEFAQSIRPVLAQNCGACHNPAKAKNPAAFLKAAAASDVDANRALW
jgi:predicted CXXCH cytochrome family protein